MSAAYICAEPHGLLIQPLLNDRFKPDKSPAADEQNIASVHLDELLVGMLPSALGGHISHRSFDELEQRLLNSFSGYVAGDGRAIALAADLVDLVNIDYAPFCPFDVVVGSLQQLENDVFDVLADIAGFG